MGPNRLARETGVTMQAAKEFIEKYFATYPQIKTYIHSSIESARERGYTETITGRRRPLEAINGQDKMLRALAENIAINSPIQGSAADLIKLAMIKIEKQFANQGIRSKMLLQVHDELVFECPSDEVDLVKNIIREEMSKALALDVPLVVDVGIGVNWLEAH
jgi:DNA polymerase I